MSRDFRETCSRLVEKVVSQSDAWFSARSVEAEGTADEFIHGVIQPGDIEFWIGSDTLEYAIGSDAYRFERASYSSPEELLREFSSALADDLGRVGRDP